MLFCVSFNHFSFFSRIIRAEVRNVQKLNQLGTGKSACLEVSSHTTANKSSASNNLLFSTSNINPSNPFFLPHCSPNYYFNQSAPFYFLRQQQNQQFASSSTQNAASTPTNQSGYDSSQLNQTPTNENYYPSSSSFNQEPILNSSTTVAHQLNSSNASFHSPNHSSSSYLNEDQPTSLSQTYTAYNSLSNSHHHSNAHHHSSSAVLNGYYNSTNNAFPSTNELANSRLMNNFISDNYSVNSLVSVSKNSSSGYSSNSGTSHLSQFKQNASQKAGLMPKLSAHQPNDAFPTGIQSANSDYMVKKAAVCYNNLSNLNNFNNLNTFNNNLDHNLDLIKNSINYFNEQQYHQCNENGSSGIDIKPKLTSIYGDINGIRNPLLFGLAKNCSSQVESHSGNELSSSATLANYTPNKLIHSLNSTGSTCSTMSSPTLSN